MKLTKKGRTWAAVALTALLAGAATIGILVPAMTLDLRTLEATVAEALDAAEAGDLTPNYLLDPDCEPENAAIRAEATKDLLTGWTFTIQDVTTVGHDGHVTIKAQSPNPEAPASVDVVDFRLHADGRWMMVEDGSC